MNRAIYKSPIGDILIREDLGYIIEIKTLSSSKENDIILEDVPNKYTEDCIEQLKEYFDGDRKIFDFKYKNIGTDFRQKIWGLLEEVPYGETITYGELAIMAGNKNASRAVGGANHHNNLWVVVPCHRVIGAGGKLTGYGGGIWRKEWLLEHEKKYS